MLGSKNDKKNIEFSKLLYQLRLLEPGKQRPESFQIRAFCLRLRDASPLAHSVSTVGNSFFITSF